MKAIKKIGLFILTVGLFLIGGTLLAQDTTVVSTPSVAGAQEWYEKASSIFAIILGVYELLVRLVPTTWNLSVLDNIMKLFKLLLPNKATKAALAEGQPQIQSFASTGQPAENKKVEVTKTGTLLHKV